MIKKSTDVATFLSGHGKAKQAKLIPIHKRRFENKLIISVAKGFLFIDFSEIEYCQAEGNYTSIYMSKGRHVMASKCLKRIDASLQGGNFIRTHQSYIISANNIRMIRNTSIELNSGHSIPLSRKYRSSLLQEVRCFVY